MIDIQSKKNRKKIIECNLCVRSLLMITIIIPFIRSKSKHRSSHYDPNRIRVLSFVYICINNNTNQKYVSHRFSFSFSLPLFFSLDKCVIESKPKQKLNSKNSIFEIDDNEVSTTCIYARCQRHIRLVSHTIGTIGS